MTFLFLSLLLTIAILSAWAIFSLIRQEKSYDKLISEQKVKIRRLDTELNERSLELEKSQKQILELKDQLLKSQEESASRSQVYEGLKDQYNELERDMEKLQQELANKETALKTEQMAHQELKEKYESLLKTTYGPKVEKEGGAI